MAIPVALLLLGFYAGVKVEGGATAKEKLEPQDKTLCNRLTQLAAVEAERIEQKCSRYRPSRYCNGVSSRASRCWGKPGCVVFMIIYAIGVSSKVIMLS